MVNALLTRSTTVVRIADLLARSTHPGVRIAHPELLDERGESVMYVAERDVQRRVLASRSGDSPRESAPPSALDAPDGHQEPTRIPQPARHAQRGATVPDATRGRADSRPLTQTAGGMSVATNPRTGTLADEQAEFACWRADQVSYLGGVLPGGEPHRSVGHWNQPRQIEIFQVQTGRFVMVVVLPDNGWTSIAEYRPGDVCIIPPGAFHITYCPDGVACVFNIYSQPQQPRPAGNGKYEGDPPPH